MDTPEYDVVSSLPHHPFGGNISLWSGGTFKIYDHPMGNISQFQFRDIGLFAIWKHHFDKKTSHVKSESIRKIIQQL